MKKVKMNIMKNVKIIIAFLIAVGVGVVFYNGTSILDQQAKALEKSLIVQAIHPDSHIVKPELKPDSHTVEPELQKTSSIESKIIAPKPFNREVASHIIAQFMAPFSMGDENGVIKGYDSLEELVQNYYLDFSGERIATAFTSECFYEKNGNVYILPTGCDTFYDDTLPAKIEKITETHYLIMQKQANGIISSIDFEFFAKEDKWKLTGVSFE
jgi:hypothetical protein